ncbi:MAG: thiol reductant ABC exporter subunit CydD [Actinomycetes bacterium]
MWPRRLLEGDLIARRWLLGSIACGTVAGASLIIWTLVLALVLSDVFIGHQHLNEVWQLVAFLVVVLFTRAAMMWLGAVASQHASNRLRSTLRANTVRQLTTVGPAGLTAERTGELSATIGAGIDSLDPYITSFLPALALSAIVPIAVLVVVGFLDPVTTLVLLFTGPMLLALLAVIGGRTRVLTQRRFVEMGWLSSFYLDMIRGLTTLKAFGRASDSAQTIGEVSRMHGESTMDVLRTAFQTSLVMEWAATAATALVAVEVSFRLVGHRMTFTTALAVLMLTPEFFIPLRRLALDYHAGQAGRTAIERLNALADLPRLVPTGPSLIPASDRSNANLTTAPSLIGPAIEFRAVRFRFPGADRDAIDAVTFRIEPGETLALVGESGAGKSTVANLLMRFIDPTSGSITSDAMPLSASDPAQWRRNVLWVPQFPTIFAGTVSDNIRLGKPDASSEEVRQAAQLSLADQFIDELPDGFDTVLGEHGLQLSGGQRQRIAIARAALRGGSIVILDEFTAHLDHESESIVITAMQRLIRERTSLVIAHRGATIEAADRVLTIDRGRIIGLDS